MEEGISIHGVSFAYNVSTPILDKITLTISKGEFLGITGINGSGKTTLTYLLNGLIPHVIRGKFSGDVTIDAIHTSSKDVSFLARKVGMIFQNPDFSLFNLTVAEEILFGLKNFKLKTDEATITQVLKIVGLQNYKERDPQSLSFGEKQKVNLASVLALHTPYIVLDEPTAMLDYKSSLELYDILHSLNTRGTTIIVVEHDTDFLWKYAQKVAIIHKGTILSIGDTKSILTQKQKLETLGIKVPNDNLGRKT